MPLDVTCTWAVRDADDDPLTCSFDGGRAKPCVTNRSASLRISTSGQRHLTLRVEDGRGGQAEGDVLVETRAPSQPPVIASFTATPASALVPFEVTFSWQISDPEGDALTCRLDRDGDGVDDVTLSDCTSTSTSRFTFSTAGSWQARLTVLDSAGGLATRTVSITGTTAPALSVDVSIARVDWGQSVISETPRLVAGKPALLRVHVLSNASHTSGITVRATGTRNGTPLGTLTLAGPTTLPTAIQESSLSKSFTATVPASWIEPGLELQVLADADGAISETDETNNARVLTPDVGAGTILYFTAVPVVHQGTTATVPSSYDSDLVRFWPLQSVQGTTRAPYTWTGTLSGSNSSAWSSLLQQIAAVSAADGSQRYYYGFVHVAYGSGIAGIGYIGSPAATGRDDSLETMVHELGHNFGRPHAPCGTSGDPNFPYAGGRIGSWGYDAQTGALVSPSSHYDLMSYCDPAWISDYNYRAAQSALEAHPPTAFAIAGSGQALLLVSGRVMADGTIDLSPLVRFHGPLEHHVDGEWTLRLHTADGTVRETRFGTERIDEIDESHFTLVVPDPGPLRAIEIARPGAPPFRRDAPDTPKALFEPRVIETAEAISLEWDVVNWPYASVAHLGKTRTTLALWLTGGRATLPTHGLPPDGALEISLSDGVSSITQIVER